MALKLQIKSSNGKVIEVLLSGGLVFGRSSEAQIKLDDPKLSSKHAQIDLIAPGNFVLVDLGSTNGIRFNGEKVTNLKLEPGVEFKMGGTEFKVLGPAVKKEVLGGQSIPPLPMMAPKAKTEQPEKKVFAPEETLAQAVVQTPPPTPEPAPPVRWSDYFVNFVQTSVAKN